MGFSPKRSPVSAADTAQAVLARSRSSGTRAGTAAPKAAAAKAALAPLEIPAGPATKHSKPKGSRALPIRSSPVSTERSLRSSLETLHAQVAPGKKTPARAEPAPFVRKPVLQELEARLLLSADLNPAAQDTLLATPAMQGAEFRALAEPSVPTVVTSAQVAPIQRTNELVFVDTETPEYQALVESMRESALAQGRNLEFVLIDAERDGIRKITDTLAQKSDLDAIHIISHATRWGGAARLHPARLRHAAQARGEREEVGRGAHRGRRHPVLRLRSRGHAEGKSLIEALARLTGADVAASEDLDRRGRQGRGLGARVQDRRDRGAGRRFRR